MFAKSVCPVAVNVWMDEPFNRLSEDLPCNFSEFLFPTVAMKVPMACDN